MPDTLIAPAVDVVRVRPDIVIRAADESSTDGRIATVEGFAARFNEWTEIDNWFEGHFIERIAERSFVKTIREAGDSVRFLFKHGFDPVIADKVLGPFDEIVERSGEGLWYAAGLYDTSFGRDLLPGLKDGQYGASFRAKVVKEEWVQTPKRSDYNPDGLPERTIRELSLAHRDIGPCTFGAYDGATATARSMTGDLLDQVLADPALLERVNRHLESLRTRDGSEAADTGTSTERAATTSGDEPAGGHSELSIPAVRMALLRHVAGLTS